ncbi:FecR family protein [Solitalea canadensis]|uniref:Fe2+-dicitrate sensor, membrane component n=1 Tax=Solitalea canadensis (strain ATCC 29591 / DSM 3403 / JCM 21819 / LMG 8368 / NBRC 15130 / NCIMB 12057 / USAM 9D) TaxID=929556 RepID=H8KPY7_SOLCM|nr:FecR domain-containing protein [Solitalea canadensis]AFD06096.1 Fe2+-dicitrate sensor, membrane component [Solitalea canadensis DSM 3403]
MDVKQVEEIVNRYNRGEASAEEARLLELWYAQALKTPLQEEEEIDYAELNQEMWRNIQMATKRDKIRWLWKKIAIAATIVCCLGLGWHFFRNSDSSLGPEKSVEVINAGQNNATLLLTNGKRLVLRDLKNESEVRLSGASITKTADGKLIYKSTGLNSAETVSMNTLITVYGEQYQIILPDGTKVWLNAASSLHFPSYFSGPNREVVLEGEAYFEVQKEKGKPFIVRTKNQEIKVLGTHFNVNCYEDELSTTTTLLEGKVSISAKLGSREGGKSIVLVPGQQSKLQNGDNRIVVAATDPSAAIAWKEGFFQFENDDIKTVMRQLSRWYNISVAYTGEIPDERFSGKVYRNMSLDKALEVLSFSAIHFQIEGRKITINYNQPK